MQSPTSTIASPKADQQFDSHGGYSLRQQVYFEHPTESWVRGHISEIKAVAKKSGFAEVCFGVIPDVDSVNVPTIGPNPPALFPLREDQIHSIVADSSGGGGGEGDEKEEECVQLTGDTVNDLLHLSYLHDSTLIEQVRRRYFRKLIYTHIGPIMLGLNPYDFTLKHYVDANLPKYMAEGDAVVSKASRNLPHAWTTAHYSYWLMSSDRENQSVVVSGESGAGKTETAKIVLKYLGYVSTSQCSDELRQTAEQVTKRVNLTSPILEAFGNAKTRMNDNSSRFGKFMKVHFANGGGAGGGVMIGAAIEVYLLEKSRIITHGAGERAYHCFYQLLASGQGSKSLSADEVKAKSALRSRVVLGDATSVPSLSIGQATVIPGVDDAHEFNDVSSAMTAVGIDEDERTAVWDVVAGILHLIQVSFDAVSDDECAVSTASDNTQHIDALQRLLGVDMAQLTSELITTTNITRGEKIVKKLRKAMSIDLRDALAKSVYEALFLWLVAKINDLIGPPDDSASAGRSWIGLLDIFGFENFAHGNSFEQMCINLANETLQNHYNSIVFTRDMNECAAEGINTASVTFYDNQPCLDLVCGVNFSQCGVGGGSAQVTNKLSIMGLIDESCSLASGTDLALCGSIVEKYGGRPSDGQGAHANFSKPKTQNNAFNILHYAGEVKYTIDGFRAKNADTLKETLKDAIRSSSIPFVQCLLAVPPASPTSGGPGGKRATVGAFFKNQLVSLMTEINSTHPHWVRCIKPHSAKKPNMFHGGEVMTQLRSAGVLETVRIRQQSYSVRLPFAEFVQRFRNILRAQTSGAASSITVDVFSTFSGALALVGGTINGHSDALQKKSTVLATLRPSHEENASDVLAEACRDILRRSGILKDELAQVGKTKVFLRTKAFHVLSQVLRIVKSSLLSSVHAYFQGYASARRTRCLQLNQDVVRIQAFLRVAPSQRVMRLKELREREKELLTRFRLLMLLQRDEHQEREGIAVEEEDSLQTALAWNQNALVELRAEWERRKIIADFEQRESACESEQAHRQQIVAAEDSSRSVLSQLFTLDWDDEQERLRISSEELQERESNLGAARLEVRAKLQAYVLGQLAVLLLAVESGEEDARSMVVKDEVETFLHLGPRMAISFQEAKLRHVLLLREADFRRDVPEMKRKHLEAIQQKWEAHKHHHDRYNLLVLQRQEQTERLQLEDDWEQELVLVIEDIDFDARQAHEAQVEREAADERARLRVVIAEREYIAEQEDRRMQEMRRVAQQLWLQNKEEEDHKAACRREAETITTLRRQQSALTKQFMEDCRRREVASRPINSSRRTSQGSSANGVALTRAAEKTRQQLVLLNAEIAMHEDTLVSLTQAEDVASRRGGVLSSGRSPSTRLSPSDGERGASLGHGGVTSTRGASQGHHSVSQLRAIPVHCGGSIEMLERLSVVRCCAASSNYANNPEHRVVARGDVEILPDVVDHSEQQKKLSRFRAAKNRQQKERLDAAEDGSGTLLLRDASISPSRQLLRSPSPQATGKSGGPLSHVSSIRQASASIPHDAGDNSHHQKHNPRATAYCNPRVHCGISIQWPSKPKSELMFPKISKNPFSDAWRPVVNAHHNRGNGGMFSYLPDGSLVELPVRAWGGVHSAAHDDAPLVNETVLADDEEDFAPMEGAGSPSPNPTRDLENLL